MERTFESKGRDLMLVLTLLSIILLTALTTPASVQPKSTIEYHTDQLGRHLVKTSYVSNGKTFQFPAYLYFGNQSLEHELGMGAYPANVFAKPSVKESQVTRMRGNVNITIPSIADKTVNVTIERTKDMSIRSIQIRFMYSVNNIKIIINKVDRIPPTVTVDVHGKVYHFLIILPLNFTDWDIGDQGEVKIGFEVEKSWISTNRINLSTITLHRYTYFYLWDIVKWSRLPTTKVGENAEHINFEAISPGLSLFAIFGEVAEPTSTHTASPTPTPNPTLTPTSKPTPTSTPAPGIWAYSWFYVVGVMIIMVVIVAYLLVRKSPS